MRYVADDRELEVRRRIAVRLRRLMQTRCVTQHELAADLDMDQSAVSHYVSGKRTPGLMRLLAFARYFGTTISYMIGEEEETGQELADAWQALDDRRAAAADEAARAARERGLVFAVDFDGTLCENAWPGIGEPREALLAYCRGAKAAGVRLILWTNRTGKQLEEAVEWCRARGLEFDAVNENFPEVIEAFGGDTRKIVADKYIDDKNADPTRIEDLWRDALRMQTARREEEQI